MKNANLTSRGMYFLFFALFVLLFLNINPSFREDDWGPIRKILNPQYYANPEFFYIDLNKYNPYYTYYYLSAFVVKLLGGADDFTLAGKLFWFIERGIIAVLFLVLANYFFKRDKLINVLTFLWVIFYVPTPWAEPKFVATVFMMLTMYFYFRKRLFAAAFFAAVIFYFHIGFATWWFLTFLFVLAWLWLKDREITFLQCLQCGLTTIIFALPVIWTYIQRITDSRVDGFTNLYAYYALGYQASPLLALQHAPGFMISRILSIVVVFLGVRKAEQLGFDLGRIRPIAWGVVALMLTQFIIGDLLKITALSKTQLIRAPVITDVLWPILASFLIAGQIRQKKYFLGILLLIVLWGYNLTPRILGWDMYAAFNAFCVLLILNEFLEKPVAAWLAQAKVQIPKSFGTACSKIGDVIFNPAVIILLALAVAFIKLPFIKPAIKSVLGMPVDTAKLEQQHKKEAFEDIISYMNKDLPYGSTAFLFPFTRSYIFSFTHHNLFNINSETPIHSLFYNNAPFKKFQVIFEEDLNCSVQKMFVDKDPACAWGMLWRNLSEDTVRPWKKKYGLTHVVRESELPLEFPVVYKNEFYVLYAVQ